MTENTITCTDFYSLEENIIRNFTANNKLDVLAHTLKVRDNALILAKKIRHRLRTGQKRRTSPRHQHPYSR